MCTNIILLFLILIINIFTFGISGSCYWNSACVYKRFSSKTPYNNVRGDLRDSNVKLKGCKPISVWALIRHGQRNPGIDFARNMIDTLAVRDYVIASYRRGNSSLCAQDVENLRDWKPSDELFGNTHGLTRDGYLEIFGIGRRLKEAFTELLSDLEDGSYSIRSASGHWVEDGVEGFTKGLSDKSLFVEDVNPQYDIMAPYESCSKYIEDVKQNEKTYIEAKSYQKSPEYKAAKERIQKRTGIQVVLTNTNITSLYDLCRYTYSVDKRGSPWCALLSEEDLAVAEYHGDLRHFYRNGYGTPLNQIFGHIPMADLYRTFVNAKVSNRKLTAYFTHATMIDMVYSALGWFKDEVPLTSAYRDPNRKWRSSTMAPLAGNLMAVLHRCNSINETETEYKIVFYINEEPVSWICDNGVCLWKEFENQFKQFLNTTIDFCFT